MEKISVRAVLATATAASMVALAATFTGTAAAAPNDIHRSTSAATLPASPTSRHSDDDDSSFGFGSFFQGDTYSQSNRRPRKCTRDRSDFYDHNNGKSEDFNDADDCRHDHDCDDHDCD